MTTTRLLQGRVRAAVVALASLGLSAALLVAAGRTLPFPRSIEPTALGAWSTEVGASTAAFTALRAGPVHEEPVRQVGRDHRSHHHRGDPRGGRPPEHSRCQGQRPEELDEDHEEREESGQA